ncbi:MAG: elongation factor 1-alpha, partial [Candidatus Bathyarchaeia archaeon]
EALPGDNIGFNVRGLSRTDIRRGDVVGPVNSPPTVVREFIGQIVVVYHPTAIAVGYTPVLHIHTATLPVKFAELIAKINPRTGEVLEDHPSFLRTGDIALVRFQPLKPVVAELYSEFPQLGRFAVRDMGMTIAAGIVKEITQKEPLEVKG